MTYLVLLLIGMISTWVGSRTSEEVHRIVVIFVGSIILVCGFTLSPLPVQLLLALILPFGLERLRWKLQLEKS